MSGTSLDGVDGSICVTDGTTIIGIEGEEYRPYSEAERAILTKVMGAWPEDRDLSDAHELILTAHAEVVSRFKQPDLIGFHGQTLAHDPKNGRTHQLGDGAEFAQRVGIKTVWDFRTPDMDLGGQGAPLAPFYHFAIAKQLGMRGPLAVLNLGGVGNVTYIDPSKPRPEMEGALIAFDTGPANAPINDLMLMHFNSAFDEDGKTAASGQVNGPWLEKAFEHPYFERMPPKSLDRNDFSDLIEELEGAPEDKIATLTAFASACVYASQMHFPKDPTRWIVCGGGRLNGVLMNALSQHLQTDVGTAERIGFNGDLIEAQAFGYLAARIMEGLPISAPSTTGCRTPSKSATITMP